MAELLYKNLDLEIRLEQSHSLINQELFFFHSNEFVKRKEVSNCLFFNLYIADLNAASIVFEVVENVAVSLPRSPFGGFSNNKIEPTLLEEFLETIIKYFKKRKLGIQIKLSPSIYDPFQEEIHALLVKKEFSTQCVDINQHIPIDQQSFTAKINRGRREQLNLCNRLGYQFKILSALSLELAYKLITECLSTKGYPITMDLEELKISFFSFPKHYLLSGVFDNDKLIATAISVKVNNKILYNFYHGDRLSYRKISPVTLLVAGIYAYCQQQQFEKLDLGISTDQGVINEGLFYFKKSCGATSSDKINYQLNFKT